MAWRNIENHSSPLCLIWIRDKLADKKSVLYHHLLLFAISTPPRIKFTIILELMIIDKRATSNNPVIYKWCWNYHLLPFMLSFNIHWLWRWEVHHHHHHHHHFDPELILELPAVLFRFQSLHSVAGLQLTICVWILLQMFNLTSFKLTDVTTPKKWRAKIPFLSKLFRDWEASGSYSCNKFYSLIDLMNNMLFTGTNGSSLLF